MDELRSTIFSFGLRRLLTEALQPGERVLWQGQPDGVARMMMWRAFWWIGFPWLLLTAIAISRGWIGQSTVPLLMVGIMMVAAPFVMLLHDLQTLVRDHQPAGADPADGLGQTNRDGDAL